MSDPSMAYRLTARDVLPDMPVANKCEVAHLLADWPWDWHVRAASTESTQGVVMAQAYCADALVRRRLTIGGH